MADGKNNAAIEVTQEENVTNGLRNDTEKADEKMEEESLRTKAVSSSFISTTDSMKNAARTKVDAIIAQVRLAFQAKDDSGTGESANDHGGAETDVVKKNMNEAIELKFVDALCDSVSFDSVLSRTIKI